MRTRRNKLKKNYLITKDFPTFLSSMGSNLISSHLSAGNVTDESQDSNADLQETLKEFLVIIVQEDLLPCLEMEMITLNILSFWKNKFT